ncbi:MAG: 50S ribosomal protein L6 [Mycoplasmataceae bacterium]|jgi:large subunit ribosomal protein L6|nr:50S ribosomal protein L6 [Mycoplasmataceae bacterium]
MSKKGNKLIKIPSGVSVSALNGVATVKGQLGELTVKYPVNVIDITNEGDTIKVSRANDEKLAKSMHGTVQSNLSNAVTGVSKGFTKTLKITGVGYRAALSGNNLTLSIGFSHPIVFAIPAGIKTVVNNQTEIVISGYNKETVGEFAANIRAIRKPEPYKGKGIAYSDEHIIRKVGKTAEGAKK